VSFPIEREVAVKSVLTLAAIVVLAFASTARSQNTIVIAGGPHDLSNGSALRNTNAAIDGQTFVFCHTPHGGSNSIPLSSCHNAHDNSLGTS
jgi:hypothetical protein